MIFLLAFELKQRPRGSRTRRTDDRWWAYEWCTAGGESGTEVQKCVELLWWGATSRTPMFATT